MTAAEPTPKDWLGAISARSAEDSKDAAEILKRHGVVAHPLLPRQRSLTVTGIRFSGTKHGEERPFEFKWEGLGPGLWGLLSDQNHRGKSSILGLVRAALQGRFPGARVKEDVWGWIEDLDLKFKIDQAAFVVSVRKPRGTAKGNAVTARLSRMDGARELVLKEGPADDEFSQALDSLFMEELGFAKFHAHRGRGEAAEHGWASMSSALFITDPGEALFGDVKADGVPLRLVQLFIGLNWVTTFTAAATAAKTVKAELDKGAEAPGGKVGKRLEQLEGQIADKRKQLKAERDTANVRARLPGLDAALVSCRRAAEAAAAEARDRRDEVADAVAVRAEARRRLLQAKEDAAAGLVFRKLRPDCCPACAEQFEKGRFEAVGTASCGLCGRAEPAAVEDQGNAVALEAAEAQAVALLKEARTALASAEKADTAAVGKVTEAANAIDAAQAELLAGSDADRLRLEIENLLARVDELKLSAQPSSDRDALAVEFKVLSAAEEVTKGLFEGLQAEVLADVSGSLMRHSVDFGVKNLESMKLESWGKLAIVQGGANLSFGGLSPGEKLRVRVALALAVLEVAKDRGYGRHPGLIVLDSPGAQETTDADFGSMIESVEKATERFADLQIIVGAVNRDELSARVPVARRRHAKGDAPLF